MGNKSRLLPDQAVGSDQAGSPNIYILSFYDIKGEESHRVRRRHELRLDAMESELATLIDQYRTREVENLKLERRAFDSHSELRWRVKDGSKRSYVTGQDERFLSVLNSLPEIDQHWLQPLSENVELLNANLKIDWTILNELYRVANFGEDTTPVTPRTILVARNDV